MEMLFQAPYSYIGLAVLVVVSFILSWFFGDFIRKLSANLAAICILGIAILTAIVVGQWIARSVGL